jgi:hypothetical protein
VLVTVAASSGWLYSTWMTVFSGALVSLGNGFAACAVAAVFVADPARNRSRQTSESCDSHHTRL